MLLTILLISVVPYSPSLTMKGEGNTLARSGEGTDDESLTST